MKLNKENEKQNMYETYQFHRTTKIWFIRDRHTCPFQLWINFPEKNISQEFSATKLNLIPGNVYHYQQKPPGKKWRAEKSFRIIIFPFHTQVR